MKKTPFLEFRRASQGEIALLSHQLRREYEGLRRIVTCPAVKPDMLDSARATHSRIGALYVQLTVLLGETNAESVARTVYLWVLNSELL